MATRKLYYDSEGNELTFWINNENKVIFDLANRLVESTFFIALDRVDLTDLISDLQALKKEIDGGLD